MRTSSHTQPTWNLQGNAIHSSPGSFLGTTNTEALEMRVKNIRVVRISDRTDPLTGAHAPAIIAGGEDSFAAEHCAIVRDADTVGGSDANGDQGTFVWSDNTATSLATAFISTGPNQFLVRATGGMGVGTNAPAAQLHVSADDIDPLKITNNGTTQLLLHDNGQITIGVTSPQDGDLVQIDAPAATDAFRVRVGGETKLRVRSDGGVSIGSNPNIDQIPDNGLRVFGNVDILGTLSKGAGSFKIDHPLDPENKYLYHSFVESPDMMNIYNGNLVTDGQSEAWVTLPDWFEALNEDFRYQLTVLGSFAQAMIAEKIKDNRFQIKTSLPNIEVSWQVTGIRHDRYAQQNRIPVEQDKPDSAKGRYLHFKAWHVEQESSAEAD